MKKYSEIGRRIKELREQLSKELKAELTQEYCAQKLKVSLRAYQNYEMGERIPSGPVLSKIAEFYDASIDYILKGDEKSLRQHQLKKLEKFAFEMEKYGIQMSPMMKDLFSIWRDLDEEGHRKILEFMEGLKLLKDKLKLSELPHKQKK